MTKWINRIFKSQAATAAVCIILGILLISMPEKFIKTVAFSVSLILLAIGLMHIGIYLKNKENGFIMDLLIGIVLSVVGIFLLINSDILIRILPIVLGSIILVDSFWTLQASLHLKKMNFVRWPWLFGMTVLFIVLALVIIFNPFETMRLATIFGGIVFLLNGLADVFFLLILKNKEKIVAKMNEIIIQDVQNAAVSGDVIDAEVSEDGHVVEEGIEHPTKNGQELIFEEEYRPEKIIIDEDDVDIVDVE